VCGGGGRERARGENTTTGSSDMNTGLSRISGTSGADPSTRLWLQQLGVTVRGADGAGGGGRGSLVKRPHHSEFICYI
jgi:hypothetical protein